MASDRMVVRISARRFVSLFRRGTVYWLPLALLFATALARLVVPDFLDRLSLLAFDGFERAAPRANSDQPVRVVAIDDKSLQEVGQWPWPRTVIADLIDKLNADGAAAITLDILFSEPDRTSPKMLMPMLTRGGASEADAEKLLAALPDPDKRLAEAVAKAPVVLGYTLGVTPGEYPLVTRAGFGFAGAAGADPLAYVDNFPDSVGDLTDLQKAAKGNGFVNQRLHWDNVLRTVPLVLRLNGRPVASLAAETLRVAIGAHTYVGRAAGANAEKSFGENTGLTAVKIGNLIVPTDGAGQVWLYYAKPDPEKVISAADVLAGKVDPGRINGTIVLIGATASGLDPLSATPIGIDMPGIEIHEQLIEQILQQSFLARPDWATGSEILFTLLVGLVLVLILPRFGALAGAALGVVAAAACCAVSWYMFRDHHILLDPAYPIAILTIVYLVATLLNHRFTERRQQEIRHAFSRYMSPHYVEQLAKDPDRLVLGGELKKMTIMFVDIRGFTTLSEGLGPHELTEFLNGFLTPMTEIVMAHHGTIDKYMGDGIMAFWNAPLDDPDHARHAVEAAQEMRARIIALNEAAAEEAQRDDAVYRPIRIGIGINTGEVCVGNFGSQQRFDYSIIGDSVNVASRLESLTKTYGVELIFGEETAAQLDADLIELDLVAVKGKTQAVQIFTLPPQPIEAAEFGVRHAALLAAYRRRDWEAALGLLADDTLSAESGMARFYALFGERIGQLRTEALPADWDGVFVALEK